MTGSLLSCSDWAGSRPETWGPLCRFFSATPGALYLKALSCLPSNSLQEEPFLVAPVARTLDQALLLSSLGFLPSNPPMLPSNLPPGACSSRPSFYPTLCFMLLCSSQRALHSVTNPFSVFKSPSGLQAQCWGAGPRGEHELSPGSLQSGQGCRCVR